MAEIINEDGLSGLDKVMLIERDRYLKAERYERTTERTGHANGFETVILTV